MERMKYFLKQQMMKVGWSIDTCVYEEMPLDDDDDVQITSVLSSRVWTSHTSHLELASLESCFHLRCGRCNYLVIGLTTVKQTVQRAKMKPKVLKTISLLSIGEHEESLSMYLAADGNGVLDLSRGSVIFQKLASRVLQ